MVRTLGQMVARPQAPHGVVRQRDPTQPGCQALVLLARPQEQARSTLHGRQVVGRNLERRPVGAQRLVPLPRFLQR